TIDGPVFNPPSVSFRTAQPVVLSPPPAGYVWRFTQDGSTVDISDPIFPPLILLTATTLIRARGFAANGRRTLESTAVYTRIDAGDSRVAAVSFSFTGTRRLSEGDLTMTDPTAGAATKYRKNGGPIINHTSPAH